MDSHFISSRASPKLRNDSNIRGGVFFINVAPLTILYVLPLVSYNLHLFD